MSLKDTSVCLTDSAFAQPRVLLKTGAEYRLWKERVANICWAATRIHVFELTDVECAALIKIYDERKEGDRITVDVVGKCWMVLLSHLSDDLFLKVSHVPPAKSLLSLPKFALA